ncbi:hypothetical protein EMIT0158MI4_140034 [Burkholderia ambifaria]
MRTPLALHARQPIPTTNAVRQDDSPRPEVAHAPLHYRVFSSYVQRNHADTAMTIDHRQRHVLFDF